MQCEIREYSSEDPTAFDAWINEASTYVAANRRGELLGFGGLQSAGRISSLFVAPEFKRIGVASRLLEHLLDEARSRGFDLVTADASEFSRPLFEKFGFSVAQVEKTQFKGVDFSRYSMRARISQVESD